MSPVHVTKCRNPVTVVIVVHEPTSAVLIVLPYLNLSLYMAKMTGYVHTVKGKDRPMLKKSGLSWTDSSSWPAGRAFYFALSSTGRNINEITRLPQR